MIAIRALLGLPTEPPPLARARDPAQMAFGFEEAPPRQRARSPARLGAVRAEVRPARLEAGHEGAPGRQIGGTRGPGGPGGGGQGGHSLGVAFTGAAPEIRPDQITIGSAGIGGPGGTGNSTAESGKGADGVATPMLAFP